VPVAHGYALCEDPSVIGSAFYVMDYVEGRRSKRERDAARARWPSSHGG
jgi:aminoglycoside phosphotransferase (APT) family kinase protein